MWRSLKRFCLMFSANCVVAKMYLLKEVGNRCNSVQLAEDARLRRILPLLHLDHNQPGQFDDFVVQA